MKTPDSSETVSIRELHRVLGKKNISRAALYEAVKRGEIPHMRIGGRVLVLRAWLMAKLKADTTTK